MKELLDQRMQEFVNMPDPELPSTLFVLRRWHRELEHKAEVREQDVGASIIDLEVRHHLKSPSDQSNASTQLGFCLQ